MPKAHTLLKQDIDNAVAIYNWIEQNKHKFKNGITQSTFFSGVVKYTAIDGSERYYSEHVHYPDPLAIKYTNHISRLKKTGYLKLAPETVNGPRVWSVNLAKLPVGAVNYTGVRTHIPEPPKVVSPTVSTESLTKLRNEGKAFIEEELKQIKVDKCTICRKGMVFNLDDATLYQLYKLGLTLNEVTEAIEDEPEDDKQAEQTDDVLETEDDAEDTATETVAPF